MNSTYLNAYTKRTILTLGRLTFRRSKLKLKPYDLKSNNIYKDITKLKTKSHYYYLYF